MEECNTTSHLIVFPSLLWSGQSLKKVSPENRKKLIKNTFFPIYWNMLTSIRSVGFWVRSAFITFYALLLQEENLIVTLHFEFQILLCAALPLVQTGRLAKVFVSVPSQIRSGGDIDI